MPHAEINLELNELCAPTALEPVLDQVTAPTRYVLATSGNLGADAKTMEQLRANLAPVIARNPNIRSRRTSKPTVCDATA
ncbi:hypothetical protein [Streptomyces regalis]|uniref:Uncharacterized protein n=1 Tax=Streptomyces regalis TaxID=68262 RepID=A0A0X3VRD5_9ACTN|nr:hypothetical protein [Streptomyces regalis]KUL46977.1 hypothetical protein ADL12_00600 [Streptomyces regalis]